MKRLLTAAVGVPIVLAALFYLPGVAFFLFIAVFFDWAALEYVEIVRPHAPHAPLALLLGFVPLVAAGLAWVLSPGTSVVPAPPALLTPSLALLAACLLASAGLGPLVRFARLPLPETIASLGILGFGTPYFARPIA